MIFILAMLLHLAPAHAQQQVPTEEAAPSQIRYDFYSESYVSVLFPGFVSQSRLRLLYPFTSQLSAYAGVNFSNDFTGSRLRYADDFISPTAGLLYKPWNFLGIFAEYRKLYRTESNELPDVESDPRYGAYVYYWYTFLQKPNLFAEFYGESVAVTRFTDKPISTAWLKIGSQQNITETLSITPYLEGYFRESPSILLGINDRSLRFGARFKWQKGNVSAQILAYRRFYSETIPEGYEGFLVLTAEGGLF